MIWFSKQFQFKLFLYIAVLQPQFCRNKIGLGSSAFARHYSRNHCYFLLLKVLRCFSSLRSPLSQIGSRPSVYWVAPFGYPRIYAYLQLPEAFRSLSRPSSPPIAKASTIRPYLLLLFLSRLTFLLSVILLWCSCYSCNKINNYKFIENLLIVNALLVVITFLLCNMSKIFLAKC